MSVGKYDKNKSIKTVNCRNWSNLAKRLTFIVIQKYSFFKTFVTAILQSNDNSFLYFKTGEYKKM